MESEETLRQNDDSTNRILQAINEMRQETRQQIGELRQEMQRQIGDLRQETRQQIGDLRREMNERFGKVETDIEDIKQSQFSFDVRLERLQAMSHDALNIGHDIKADVKMLTVEVRAWAIEVTNLQQKM